MSLHNCVDIMNMHFDLNFRHRHKEIGHSIIWIKRNMNWLNSSLISNFQVLRKCFDAGISQLGLVRSLKMNIRLNTDKKNCNKHFYLVTF